MASLFRLILLLSLSIPAYSNIISNNVVLKYYFNNNLYDKSGNNNDLNDHCGGFAKDRLGNNNASYFLYGSKDSIIIAENYLASLTGDFTVSFWMQSSRDTDSMRLVTFKPADNDTSNVSFFLNKYTGSYVTAFNTDSMIMSAPGNYFAYTNNFWHHFVIKREGSKFFWYIDNLPADSCDNFLPASTGFEIIFGGNKYYGNIDDISIYNTALGNAQINNLFYEYPFWLDFKSNVAYTHDAKPVVGWNADPSLYHFINIEFSTDSGSTWSSLAEQIPVSDLSFSWQLKDLFSNNCFVRIINNEADTLIAQTEKFGITNYEWKNATESAAFKPQDGAGAVVFNDKMWLLGGWRCTFTPDEECKSHNQVWNSTDGVQWNYINNAPWHGRHCAGYVVYKNKIWIVGGDGNSGYYEYDVWNSSNGIDWQLIRKKAPWGPRAVHYVTVFDDKIWVMGGQIIYGDSIYNDVWNTTDGENWEKVCQHAGWSPRGLIEGSAVFNNKMWIIGGGVYQLTYKNDVWSSADGINWEASTYDAPWHPRQYHNIITYDNKLWVIGGWDGVENRGDVWFSSNGKDWTELVHTAWPGRHASSIFAYKKSLWVVAGNYINDSWKLINVSNPYVEPPVEPESSINKTILYPNPTSSNQLTVEVSPDINISPFSVEVINSSGQICIDKKYSSDSEKIYLDIHTIPMGLYLIRIKNTNREIVYQDKFIKY